MNKRTARKILKNEWRYDWCVIERAMRTLHLKPSPSIWNYKSVHEAYLETVSDGLFKNATELLGIIGS